MAAGARPDRYAVGETILQTGREGAVGLYVLWTGTARMSIDLEDGSSVTVAEMSEGDVFGLIGRSDRWPDLPRTVAVTDCEIVVVDNAVAQMVTSHDPALASALNQVMNARRRRIDRIVEGSTRRGAVQAAADAVFDLVRFAGRKYL